MTKRKSNKSQPLKNVVSGLTAPLAPRPAARVEPPTTKKRRKARAPVDTQTRQAQTQTAREAKRAREALRKRGIPPTTRQAEEFIRRSIASQRAAAKMTPAQRSDRSRKGWDTSAQRGTRHALKRDIRETSQNARDKYNRREHPATPEVKRHPGNHRKGGPLPF